jgi:DNA-directed RNA polymerase subunit RPC12/RpoP
MIVIYRCELCDKHMNVEGNVLGETITCPHCGIDTRLIPVRNPTNQGGFPPKPAHPPKQTRTANGVKELKTRPVYRMEGRGEVLEVYEDKVSIISEGISAFLSQGLSGLKGTKTIPFFSIMAVQFKTAGFTNGYLQFSIVGGIENEGGILGTGGFGEPVNNNTFPFTNGFFGNSDNNEIAAEIKNFIEGKIRELRTAPQKAVSSTSLSDELAKLANLKNQGALSEEEFQAAKRKLIGG